MITHRPLKSLPTTTLPWLSLRDHFVATVGAAAGQGKPLGNLLVLADATFAPHSRFPLHPHEDMEILSIVIDGELSHHGDQANGQTLQARSAQLISARSGIVHAEGNDTDAPVRMLQLWFQPNAVGGAPQYFSKRFESPGRTLVAGDEAIPLRADVKVWWVDVAPGTPQKFEVLANRSGYLMSLKGTVSLNGSTTVTDGEGAAIGQGSLEVTARQPSAVLWVDVLTAR